MDKVTIDKGIPIPRGHGGARSGAPEWPWKDMQVGDSFFGPNTVQTVAQRKAKEELLQVAGGKRAIPGSEWSTRFVTENGVRGVRVWRTK